jgi:hypothetical protein
MTSTDARVRRVQVCVMQSLCQRCGGTVRAGESQTHLKLIFCDQIVIVTLSMSKKSRSRGYHTQNAYKHV